MMERGPTALFGAIVAVGLGPALWLGAQFGQAAVLPAPPPAITVDNKGEAPGHAGAADEPATLGGTPTRTADDDDDRDLVPLSETSSSRKGTNRPGSRPASTPASTAPTTPSATPSRSAVPTTPTPTGPTESPGVDPSEPTKEPSSPESPLPTRDPDDETDEGVTERSLI